MLTPYKETEAHGKNFARPLPEVLNDEEHYEVEEIVDSKKQGWGTKYLVKWMGYPEADDTWEPYTLLKGMAEEAMKKLHDRYPNKPPIPWPLPLTGYETFPYPRGVPTRRNRLSIEGTKEEGVEEPKQPSNMEQLLAGVFDTGLERLLLVLDFVRTRDRITGVAAELATLIWRLEKIALGLGLSSTPGML
ncbi:hypothetical protein HETIRDRAFT_450354 [Heterobasidion irregulare TC 32-1]|uniref:Chromo domain-containing protein n=1 Tax=Heterobasidion irregulare (strain TC 32-1) TaxID=747525 RepID=W4K9J4_HETIT|nr:uncharacterized protein HETIRDRAFT_450354 [Heterobasidion irregulare TC 32-1]ETW82507.1 hypothetical protein HETIRDRAFT_450354 [Heterobasidion irregulare TC 32-1]